MTPEPQEFTNPGAPVPAKVTSHPLSLRTRRELLGDVVRVGIVMIVLGLFFFEFALALVAISFGANGDDIKDVLSFGLAPLAAIAGAFAAYFFPSSTGSG